MQEQMKAKLIEKQVQEIMQRNVFLANLDHTWTDVARKMSAKKIHHIVVVDENHAPLTVVSSFDFLIFAHGDRSPRADRPLRDSLDSRRLIAVEESQHVYDAMNEMNNHHVEMIVVVNAERRAVGILTPTDIMNLLYAEIE